MEKEHISVVSGGAGEQEGAAGGFHGDRKIPAEGNVCLVGSVSFQRFFELVQVIAEASFCIQKDLLGIVTFAELPFPVLVLGNRVIAAGSVLREEDEAPLLRIVDVDDAGRCPYPVVLGKDFSILIGAFLIGVVDDIGLPLHAGEVYTVILAVFRSAAVLQTFGDGCEGDHYLDAPSLVFCIGIVDGALHMDSRLKAVDIVAVQSVAVVAVSHRQEEIPDGVQHVHLELIVLGGIGIRVDEDLEIVVLENDIVPFGHMAPDLISVELCAKVEIFVIPEHLCPGEEAGGRHVAALDIEESVGEGSVLPEGFVDVSVQVEGFRCSAADVDGRLEVYGRDRNTNLTHCEIPLFFIFEMFRAAKTER